MTPLGATVGSVVIRLGWT